MFSKVNLALFADEVKTINKIQIHEAVKILLEELPSFAKHVGDKKDRVAEIWADSVAGEFSYIEGAFPREMIIKFIIFYRDLEVALRGENRLLLQNGEEKLSNMSNLNLAALFMIVKKGFPIEVRNSKLEEKTEYINKEE